MKDIYCLSIRENFTNGAVPNDSAGIEGSVTVNVATCNVTSHSNSTGPHFGVLIPVYIKGHDHYP